MDTQDKHTPGPWWVGYDSCIASGYGEDYVTIAEVFREADRELIARAPELLSENQRLQKLNTELAKATTDLLKILDEMMPYVGQMALQDYRMLNEVPIKARAALAEAIRD